MEKKMDGYVVRPVKYHPNILVSACAKVWVNGIRKKVYRNADGYVNVSGTGLPTARRHRLVAMAWKDVPIGYASMDVNHLNHTPGSDHESNLEWTTRRRNIQHSVNALRFGNFEVFAMDIKTREMKGYPSLNEAAKGIGIASSRISKGLVGEGTFVQDNMVIGRCPNKMTDYLGHSLSEMFKYGTIRIYNEKGEILSEGLTMREVVESDLISIGKSTLIGRLKTTGSWIEPNRRLTFLFAGEENHIEPRIISRNYPGFARKIDTGEIEEYENIPKMCIARGWDLSRVLIALQVNGSDITIDGIYDIGVDRDFISTYRLPTGTLSNPDISRMHGPQKIIPIKVQDITTFEEKVYPSLKEAARQTGITSHLMGTVVKGGGCKLMRPKWRVSGDTSYVFPKENTFKDIMTVSGVKLIDLSGNTIASGPSKRSYAEQVAEKNLGSRDGVRKYFDSHTTNMIKKGYKVLLTVGDKEYLPNELKR